MTDLTAQAATESKAPTRKRRGLAWHARRHPTVALGAAMIMVVIVATLFAPLLTSHDPLFLDPLKRMQPPSWIHLSGTDGIGRDVWSRTIHGGRVSLVVGLVVATLSTIIGLLIGLVSGYNRIADAILMRFMDGLMSIPAILLAIALMVVVKGSVTTA